MYVKKLLDKYSSPTAGQLLARVAIKGGFLELPNLSVQEEYKDEFYNSLAPDYSTLAFYDWRELYDEISATIAGFNNNETQISRYVCSILMPFVEISEYFFPSDKNNQGYAELAKFLRDYASKKYNADKEKAQIQKKAEEKFKDSNYVKVLPDGTLNYIYLNYIEEEEKKIYMSNDFFDHKFLIQIIYTVSRLASAIEGALLINRAPNGLFEYQEMCGVVLCKSFDAKRLCEHLGWTEKIANMYLPAPICYQDKKNNNIYIGHHRATDVLEIDYLLKRFNAGSLQCTEEELRPYLASFQTKCKEMANNNISREEKKAWIVKILDALGEIYIGDKAEYNYCYSNAVAEFWGCLEAEFLASAEQICVRKIALKLDLEDILNAPYRGKGMKYYVSDNPEGKKPYSLLYSKLWPKLGWATHYHERRICEACNDLSCIYRYGVKNLTLKEKEYKKENNPDTIGKGQCMNNAPKITKKKRVWKQAETEKFFESKLANHIISKIRALDCVEADEAGRYKWTGDSELYSYMCYKLCETILPKGSQLEVSYIFKKIIYADYKFETMRSYAGKYKNRTKMSPKNHRIIDNIINKAKEINFSSIPDNE